MALHLSLLQFPSSQHPNKFTKPTPILINNSKKPLNFRKITKSPRFHLKATSTEEGDQPIVEQQPQKSSETDDVADLGAEVRKAMEEREKEKEGDFWGGVVEEVGEIEWPAFGKVAGITGVVLGVIFGSSVVLLTLNAVLAELSDRVFVGRGVQDFFG